MALIKSSYCKSSTKGGCPGALLRFVQVCLFPPCHMQTSVVSVLWWVAMYLVILDPAPEVEGPRVFLCFAMPSFPACVFNPGAGIMFESSRPHIGGGRRKAEERRKGMGVFRRHNCWLHAPHLCFKTRRKNEITTIRRRASLADYDERGEVDLTYDMRLFLKTSRQRPAPGRR